MTTPSDRTEQQTRDQQDRAQRLSLQRTTPPGDAPGYEIQRFLGAGAYGEVWVALDRNTGRQVAIKFYTHRGGLDWPLLSREVEKLVFLSADRYVVQLLDVGWTAEPPFYVMEYVEKGSLDDLLLRDGTMPVEEAVEMFREVAIGLTHAHGKGVLHCDLKPANILLDQDNRPRLADFGQSRLSHEQTPALGTLFYMAPEQADMDAVPDARWDVYALGAILYRLLVGKPPYRDEETVKAIDTASELQERLRRYRQHIHESSIPAAHRGVARVDGSLSDIVDNCLAKNPRDRFPNAQAVLEALRTRQNRQTRRPLLVLGVLGPVLLLMIMTMFYGRGFSRAVQQSEASINQQAYQSNEFAAKFVAKSFEGEVADYFETVEKEALRGDLASLLTRVETTPRFQSLSAASRGQAPDEELVDEFRADPTQVELKNYLAARLMSHTDGTADEKIRFASLFVIDRWGTMVASTYREPIKSRSVGRNYSWRTYFHGGPEDLERAYPAELPPHIQRTHLSAVFKSTTTNKWKMAISTPIYQRPDNRTGFLGVLALTVDLGDFAIFREDRTRSDYFAVLIDDRQGERKGTILQHPLFLSNSPSRDFKLRPEQLTKLRAERDFAYVDPLSRAPGGQSFDGYWIAATEPVRLPRVGREADGVSDSTNLLVMVQVNRNVVSAPIKQLRKRLMNDGLFALSFIVLVVIVMWVIVYRLLRDGDRVRAARSNVASSSESPHTRPTVTRQ